MPEAMQEYSAFTVAYSTLANRLISESAVIIYNGRDLTVNALWDTGATITCVSEETAQKLSMISTGKINIKTPSGTKQKNTYLVDIILPNNVSVKDLTVCDSEIGSQGIDLLIGMDIILLGDFAVSNYQGQTTFTFRLPSKQTTDYVKQVNIDHIIGNRNKKRK